MGEQNHFIVNLGGGLNLVDTHYTLQQRLGSARELINYEPSIRGGYRRINGYEKFCTMRPTDPVGEATIHCAVTNYLSDSFWTGTTGIAWDGTVWDLDSGTNLYTLTQTGGWNTGFRPSTLRITIYKSSVGYNGPNWTLNVKDTNGDTIGSTTFDAEAYDVNVTKDVTLTFGSFDINTIEGTEVLYNTPEIRCINFV